MSPNPPSSRCGLRHEDPTTTVKLNDEISLMVAKRDGARSSMGLFLEVFSLNGHIHWALVNKCGSCGTLFVQSVNEILSIAW